MTVLNGYVELGFKYPCETEPIRDLPSRSSDREVGSLGSESIYTNTCQFEVRDQCFHAHFTRKGDNGRQQQTAIIAYIAE